MQTGIKPRKLLSRFTNYNFSKKVSEKHLLALYVYTYLAIKYIANSNH
jgi:hypothetical protein